MQTMSTWLDVRRGVLAVALVAAALTACSSVEERSSQSPQTAPSATAPSPPVDAPESHQVELEPLVAPMRLASVRWSRGNVPRSVPAADESLPSVLTDPPGRAVVASYVPRPTSGFAGEAIEFYGTDGRWRRLELGALDLPADGWNGSDTFGAGALSPDGRWWAGPMFNGMFLVDLSDGSATVRRVDGQGGVGSFEWSPDSDELVLVVSGNSWRVSVPELQVRDFPRPANYPELLANGTWVECPHEARRVTACRTYASNGSVVEERQVPLELTARWSAPLGEVDRSVFYSMPHGAYGNRRHDWEVLRTDRDFDANARLVLPAGSDINGVGDIFDAPTLGLAAINDRLLLAWLVDEGELVKVLRPDFGTQIGGMDWWSVSFARNLMSVR